MNLGVYLRPEAEEDVGEAARWYEKQQVHLGTEFLDEVLEHCAMISENPKMYPVIYRKTRRAIIQRFPFGIFYQIEKEFIVVLAVLHGSRNPKQWQQRVRGLL